MRKQTLFYLSILSCMISLRALAAGPTVWEEVYPNDISGESALVQDAAAGLETGSGLILAGKGAMEQGAKSETLKYLKKNERALAISNSVDSVIDSTKGGQIRAEGHIDRVLTLEGISKGRLDEAQAQLELEVRKILRKEKLRQIDIDAANRELVMQMAKGQTRKAAVSLALSRLMIGAGLLSIADGGVRLGAAINARDPGYLPSVTLSRGMLQKLPPRDKPAAESAGADTTMTAE